MALRPTAQIAKWVGFFDRLSEARAARGVSSLSRSGRARTFRSLPRPTSNTSSELYQQELPASAASIASRPTRGSLESSMSSAHGRHRSRHHLSAAGCGPGVESSSAFATTRACSRSPVVTSVQSSAASARSSCTPEARRGFPSKPRKGKKWNFRTQGHRHRRSPGHGRALRHATRRGRRERGCWRRRRGRPRELCRTGSLSVGST